MIWFSCKQCGKTHGRPESAIGATIFCDCGAGTIVPWESTVAEPPLPVAEPDSAPELNLEPISFAAPPSQPPPPGKAYAPPRHRPRSRELAAPRDPLYCFNHQDTLKDGDCGDCRESFCSSCLVEFQGAFLCGPCKNYRVKKMLRPHAASNLSILSLVVALAASVVLFLLPTHRSGIPWWLLPALAPPSLAGMLAILALRQAAKDPNAGGRAMALTSLSGAALIIVLMVFLAMYSPRIWT